MKLALEFGLLNVHTIPGCSPVFLNQEAFIILSLYRKTIQSTNYSQIYGKCLVSSLDGFHLRLPNGGVDLWTKCVSSTIIAMY